jgi:DNA-binding NarL/FixJ family response regulator
MHDSKSLLEAAERVGATGLVLKSFAARDLIKGLETIIAGQTFFESVPELRSNRTGTTSRHCFDSNLPFSSIVDFSHRLQDQANWTKNGIWPRAEKRSPR